MTTKLLQICELSLEREFNPRETLDLLKRYGFKFWSWGASNFVNLKDKGLLFKVNGHHHKGYVLITLNHWDTYVVTLLSTQGNQKYREENIYFDQLFEIIDNKIERIPEYTD